MGNAALIPIILPNYNVTVDGAQIGFGHAAFILVQSDGTATYYEYGLYQSSQFNLTNSGDGDIRSLSLLPMQFDSSGNVTTASIEGALNEVFGSSGMYSTDTGEAIGAVYNLTPDQAASVQGFINGQEAAINDGDETYSIVNSNDCLNFVYNAADAAGITISSSQNFSSIAEPAFAASDLITDGSNNSFQYFSPDSWHANSIGPTSGTDFETSDVEDAVVQLGNSLEGAFTNLYNSLSSGVQSLFNNISNDIITPAYGADGVTKDSITITDGQGDTATVITNQGQTYTASDGETVLDVEGGNTISADSGTTVAVLGGGTTVLAGGTTDAPDTVNASNATVMLADDLSGETINGSGNTVDLGVGAGDVADYGNNNGEAIIDGNNNTVNMAANSGALDSIDGTGDVVTGNTGSNQLDLVGTGTSATVNGDGWVGLTGSDQTVTLESAGASVGTDSNTDDTIIGSSDTIYLDPGQGLATVDGNNNAVAMADGSDSLDSIDGTGDVVTGDSFANQLDLIGAGSTATVQGEDGIVDLDNSDQIVTLGERRHFGGHRRRRHRRDDRWLGRHCEHGGEQRLDGGRRRHRRGGDGRYRVGPIGPDRSQHQRDGEPQRLR